MAWIESHQSLLTHRKTLRASALLKVNKYQLIGHLHALWWWGLDNAKDDGDLGQCLHEEIAEAAGWPPKRAGDFVSALLSVRFLDSPDGGATLALHNWWRYAGKLNAKRAKDRERKAGDSVGSSAEVAANSQAPTNQPPPPTNQPTVPTVIAMRSHPLNFTDAEWSEIVTEFPATNPQGRWKEWVKWIEEGGGRRTPDNKTEAFKGWLRKKTTRAATA